MKFTPLTPRRLLDEAIMSQRAACKGKTIFTQNLIWLSGKIDKIERDENQKNHVRDFLRDTYAKNLMRKRQRSYWYGYLFV